MPRPNPKPSPRRQGPDRLPDPEQVLEGNLSVDNAYPTDFPEDYTDLVDCIPPFDEDYD